MKEVEDYRLVADRVRRPYVWCLYSWVAILGGVFVYKPLVRSGGVIGPVLIMVGMLLSVISFVLSVHGMVVTRQRWVAFGGATLLSSLPFVLAAWMMK